MMGSKLAKRFSHTARTRLPDKLQGAVALPATDWLTSDARTAIGECPGPHCGWLCVDRSKGQRRVSTGGALVKIAGEAVAWVAEGLGQARVEFLGR